MKPLISYSPDDDQHIFLQKDISIDSKTITLSACTISGKKYRNSQQDKNEDAFSIVGDETTLIASIFDGASGAAVAIDALGGEKGGRFASHFAKQEIEKIKNKQSLKDMLLCINIALHQRIAKFVDIHPETIYQLPATVATIAKVDFKKNLLQVAHVGDTFCLVAYRDNSVECITKDQVRVFDEINYAVMQKVAKEKKISVRETMGTPEVKESMEFTATTRNKPDGTGKGYLNGDGAVAEYIQTIQLPLQNIRALFLGTDGIIPPGWDLEKQEDRQHFFALLESGGLQSIVKTKKDIEDNDPNWHIVRYKHSDDATGVYIQWA